jgi:hypothetical protein
MSGRNRISRPSGTASITCRAFPDVGQRLHLGGRVDVGDNHGAGILGLPAAERIGVDGGGQRAPGVQIRDQHGLLGAEDGGRLGHEVNAGEHDHVGLCAGRLLRQPQRVADVVGHVLHVGTLIVVGQDHGLPFLGERPNLFVQPGGLLDHC